MNESLFRSISTAVRPWDSIHSRSENDLRLDRRQKVVDQRDIDDCLSCPKPECTNCKRYSSNRYGYVYKVG